MYKWSNITQAVPNNEHRALVQEFDRNNHSSLNPATPLASRLLTLYSLSYDGYKTQGAKQMVGFFPLIESLSELLQYFKGKSCNSVDP